VNLDRPHKEIYVRVQTVLEWEFVQDLTEMGLASRTRQNLGVTVDQAYKCEFVLVREDGRRRKARNVERAPKVRPPVLHLFWTDKNICQVQSMGPYLVEDIFAIRKGYTIKFENEIVIIDDMFADWTKIRSLFFDTPAPAFNIRDGTRNFKDYYQCRQHLINKFPFQIEIQNLIQKVWGERTTFQNELYTNWFKQICTRDSDYANVHTDPGDYAMILYLNSELESCGGTAFFTGGEVQGYPETYWAKDPPEPYFKVEMKPGRVVLFRSKVTPHAAWFPRDGFVEFPRVTTVCWFDKDFSS
jgi:hypothetical protein